MRDPYPGTILRDQRNMSLSNGIVTRVLARGLRLFEFCLRQRASLFAFDQRERQRSQNAIQKIPFECAA